jgi:hypothetical protein
MIMRDRYDEGRMFIQFNETHYTRIAPASSPWKGALKLLHGCILVAPKELSYWIEDGTTDQHT